MVLGVVAALPSYAVIMLRPRWRVDETLDVLAAHGVAGFTGILFIGFVAQQAWNGVADGAASTATPRSSASRRWPRSPRPPTRSRATFVLLKLIGAVQRRCGRREREEALGMDIVSPRRGGLRHRRGRDPGGAGHPGAAALPRRSPVAGVAGG